MSLSRRIARQNCLRADHTCVYLSFQFRNVRVASKIKTNNETIQNVIELIKFISIFKNQTKSAEPQAIPIKISLNKGSLYINKIPIYQFPIKY